MPSIPEQSAACEDALRVILTFVLGYSKSTQPISRLRACQFANEILDNLPDNGAVIELIVDDVRSELLDRLMDKDAKVRWLAVHALKRLPCAVQVCQGNRVGREGS